MWSEFIALDEHVLLTTNRKYFEICSFVQFGCLKVQYTHTTISFIDLKINFKVESFLKIQNYNFFFLTQDFLFFFFIGILTYIIINLIQLFYFFFAFFPKQMHQIFAHFFSSYFCYWILYHYYLHGQSMISFLSFFIIIPKFDFVKSEHFPVESIWFVSCCDPLWIWTKNRISSKNHANYLWYWGN